LRCRVLQLTQNTFIVAALVEGHVLRHNILEMKILAISDQVVDNLYSSALKQNFGDVDLVLGCGDLPYNYLEFIVSVLSVPLIYVPGNHDPRHNPEDPESYAEGCQNIDLSLTQVKGLTLAGVGGSVRYQPEGVNQYSQAEMSLRMLKLARRWAWHNLAGRPAVDILITHSPPYGIHDDDDPAHIGFKSLRHLIQIFKPRLLLHGHTIFYKNNLTSHETRIGQTNVVNIYPYRLIEVDHV